MDFLHTVGQLLLTSVLPGLATAAGALLIGLLQRQLKRAGIELTEKQTEQVRRLVENAIVAVEELARRRALAGQPLDSDEKLKETLVRVLIQRPDLHEQDVKDTIDAMLPKVRQLIPMTRVPALPPAGTGMPTSIRRP